MNKKVPNHLSGSRSGNRKSKIQKRPRGRKWAGLLSVVITFAMCGAVQAQPAKIPRIGYLAGNPLPKGSPRTEALRQGLRELGYEEGKNIIIEWRSAEGKFDRLPALAAELVNLKVDVIVSQGPISTRPAKDATTTIPIVMGFDNDPVGSGVIASLARPGGNITGLSSLAPEISGKQLEILKEVLPKLASVAVLGNRNEPGNAQNLKEVELAAKTLEIKAHYLNVASANEIDAAFQEASKARAGGLLVLQNPVFIPQQNHVIELAAKNRLAAMYPSAADFVDAGGLMTYSTSVPDLYRRAATYVDKILKGTKPADLPVEQPKKFEFVVNLKAAKQISLTIPPNVVARADRVIR